MVKKADFPTGVARALQLFLQPIQLLGIHVIAVQGEELHVALFKGVVSGAIHVEGFVEALDAGVVVVAQRGVEFDPRIQEFLVRAGEFSFEVRSFVAAVNVVTKSDYKFVGKCFVLFVHLCRGFILGLFAGAHISDGRETHGIGLQRELEILGALARRQKQYKKEESALHSHWLSAAPAGITLTRKSTTRLVLASSNTRSWPTAR